MNSEKIIGYLLLIIGIVIILASTFSVYQVFTGRQKPPSVFSFEVPGISLPGSQTTQFKLPQGMTLPEGFSLPESLSPETKTETPEIKILPDEMINNLTNMSTYFLLMMFVASSGAKIASIGAKMIKDIKVVVKGEEIKQNLQDVSKNVPEEN